MKKIIFLLLLNGMMKSQQLSIVASSFNQTDSICPNTTQWIDIKQVSFLGGPYYGNIGIQIANNDTSQIVNIIDWDILTVNSDGSRGVSFVTPDNDLYSGVFSINISNSQGPYNGLMHKYAVCFSGIETYHSAADLMSTDYYNLLGQPIKEPDGVTVEIKTYKDGTKSVRKILITD